MEHGEDWRAAPELGPPVKGQQELLAFNRGLMSRLGLARIDLKRTALAAQTMMNWMPRTLGSMMLRPGLQYITATRTNKVTKLIPFVFASDDVASIEVTQSEIRVLVDDTPITRAAVTAAVANGTFDTNLTSWTDADEGSAASTWATGGYMSLVGTGASAARRRQQVTVTETGTEHALNIVITRGPATLKVGSSAGTDSYISETELGPGYHSLAFTPSGDFHIELSNRTINAALVDSVAVASGGVMVLTSPWQEDDLSLLRYDQSGDVVFVACEGYQQRKIERRGASSWSVVKYQTSDGPFRTENTGPITITPSALTGNITLTASAALFKSTHVGALFSLTSTGQSVAASISAQNTFTDPIRITGVDSNRVFSIQISGTWTATVTVQRSLDSESGPWENLGTTYTANTVVSYDDTLDNQIVWYRIGVRTGDYTSGTVDVALSYALGSILGTARVTAFTSSTVVDAEVLNAMGAITATDAWAEGYWSDYRGWPSAVAFHDGRLFWVGKDRFWGSITDAFDSFDAQFEGDAGPISRSIGSGPVDSINWLVSLQRLIAGTDGAVVSVKSSSLDEPLTPTNFTPKAMASQGSARVMAAKIDGRAVFVQRGGSRLFQVVYSPETYDYGVDDLTSVVPDIGSPGIVAIAVQRQPDTRVHCVRSDGTVAVLVFDPAENVQCWVEVETDGLVEDAMVLPGAAEDAVYYVVARTIGGSTVRYIEKWATEEECRGAAITKLADSFVYAAGAASTITGLSHLEGETVVAWGGGESLGEFTVSGGSITLAASVTHRCAGLGYRARFKSAKLAYVIEQGHSGLTARKRVNSLGLILADTHAQGVGFGPDFDNLDDMPMMEREVAVDQGSVWDEYDADPIPFPGAWDTDSRVCLEANAPKPCTVLAVVVGQASSPNG